MLRLTTLLRSLGPVGAAANARAALDQRQREAWVVDALVLRIPPAPAAASDAPAGAPASTRVA